MSQYEVSKCKNLYINFLQLEIFVIKAAEKHLGNNTKICEFFIITSKIFLVMERVRYDWKGFILLYLMMDLL